MNLLLPNSSYSCLHSFYMLLVTPSLIDHYLSKTGSCIKELFCWIHSTKLLIGHLGNLLIFPSLYNKLNYKLDLWKDHYLVHMLWKLGSRTTLHQKDTVSQMTTLSIIKVTKSNIAYKGRKIKIPPFVTLKWYYMTCETDTQSPMA